jgi:hypothetical protein
MNANQKSHEFALSVEEMNTLQSITTKNDSLNAVIKRAMAVHGIKFRLRLNRIEAEAVRDILTEQLAYSGFQEDYSLTTQGQMLESLIDRFYIT